jgi:hypothetical protein
MPKKYGESGCRPKSGTFTAQLSKVMAVLADPARVGRDRCAGPNVRFRG